MLCLSKMGEIMVDIRSEPQGINKERRIDPRLAFHCDATAMGFNGIQTITDISIGGFYLKGAVPDRIEIGQIETINVKLPSEKYVTRLKANIVRKTHQGIGCQLVNQNGHERAALSRFIKLYNFYNDIDFNAFD